MTLSLIVDMIGLGLGTHPSLTPSPDPGGRTVPATRAPGPAVRGKPELAGGQRPTKYHARGASVLPVQEDAE